MPTLHIPDHELNYLRTSHSTHCSSRSVFGRTEPMRSGRRGRGRATRRLAFSQAFGLTILLDSCRRSAMLLGDSAFERS